MEQEIKNHRDAVNASRMEIEAFKQKLDEISQNIDVKIAALQSQTKSDRTAMDMVQEQIYAQVDQFHSQINNISQYCEKSFKSLRTTMDTRDSYFLTIDGFKDFECKVDQLLATLRLSISQYKDTISQELEKIDESISKSFNQTKSILDIELSKIDSHINKINSDLDVYAINFSGQQKEIELVKKRCFYIEKNIENLYTQIERLKDANP